MGDLGKSLFSGPLRMMVGSASRALLILWSIRERQTELGTYIMVAELLRDPDQCREEGAVIRQSEANVKLQFG